MPNVVFRIWLVTPRKKNGEIDLTSKSDVEFDRWPLYASNEEDITKRALEPSLSMEFGKIFSLRFDVLPNHICYHKLLEFQTYVYVEQNDTVLMRGRVLNIDINVDKTKSVTCEGDLAYLGDTIYSPDDKVNHTPVEWYPYQQFNYILEQHNNWMFNASIRKFYPGNMASDYSTKKTHKYEMTSYSVPKDRIEDDLISHFGGYLVSETSVLDDISGSSLTIWGQTYTGIDLTKVLEYKTTVYDGGSDPEVKHYYFTRLCYYGYDSAAPSNDRQTIELTKNIIDINRKYDTGDYYNCILPIGKDAKILTGYTDDHTVDPDDPNEYYKDTQFTLHGTTYTASHHFTRTSGADIGDSVVMVKEEVKKYGRIVKAQDFGDAETFQDIYNKAVEYLKNNWHPVDESFDVKAVDLKWADPTVKTFHLGGMYKIIETYGENSPFNVTVQKNLMSIEYQFDQPEATSLNFGFDYQSVQDFDSSPSAGRSYSSGGRSHSYSANSGGFFNTPMQVDSNNISWNPTEINIGGTQTLNLIGNKVNIKGSGNKAATVHINNTLETYKVKVIKGTGSDQGGGSLEVAGDSSLHKTTVNGALTAKTLYKSGNSNEWFAHHHKLTITENSAHDGRLDYDLGTASWDQEEYSGNFNMADTAFYAREVAAAKESVQIESIEAIGSLTITWTGDQPTIISEVKATADNENELTETLSFTDSLLKNTIQNVTSGTPNVDSSDKWQLPLTIERKHGQDTAWLIPLKVSATAVVSAAQKTGASNTVKIAANGYAKWDTVIVATAAESSKELVVTSDVGYSWNSNGTVSISSTSNIKDGSTALATATDSDVVPSNGVSSIAVNGSVSYDSQENRYTVPVIVNRDHGPSSTFSNINFVATEAYANGQAHGSGSSVASIKIVPTSRHYWQPPDQNYPEGFYTIMVAAYDEDGNELKRATIGERNDSADAATTPWAINAYAAYHAGQNATEVSLSVSGSRNNDAPGETSNRNNGITITATWGNQSKSISRYMTKCAGPYYTTNSHIKYYTVTINRNDYVVAG